MRFSNLPLSVQAQLAPLALIDQNELNKEVALEQALIQKYNKETLDKKKLLLKDPPVPETAPIPQFTFIDFAALPGLPPLIKGKRRLMEILKLSVPVVVEVAPEFVAEVDNVENKEVEKAIEVAAFLENINEPEVIEPDNLSNFHTQRKGIFKNSLSMLNIRNTISSINSTDIKSTLLNPDLVNLFPNDNQFLNAFQKSSEQIIELINKQGETSRELISTFMSAQVGKNNDNLEVMHKLETKLENLKINQMLSSKVTNASMRTLKTSINTINKKDETFQKGNTEQLKKIYQRLRFKKNEISQLTSHLNELQDANKDGEKIIEYVKTQIEKLKHQNEVNQIQNSSLASLHENNLSKIDLKVEIVKGLFSTEMETIKKSHQNLLVTMEEGKQNTQNILNELELDINQNFSSNDEILKGSTNILKNYLQTDTEEKKTLLKQVENLKNQVDLFIPLISKVQDPLEPNSMVTEAHAVSSNLIETSNILSRQLSILQPIADNVTSSNVVDDIKIIEATNDTPVTFDREVEKHVIDKVALLEEIDSLTKDTSSLTMEPNTVDQVEQTLSNSVTPLPSEIAVPIPINQERPTSPSVIDNILNFIGLGSSTTEQDLPQNPPDNSVQQSSTTSIESQAENSNADADEVFSPDADETIEPENGWEYNVYLMSKQIVNANFQLYTGPESGAANKNMLKWKKTKKPKDQNVMVRFTPALFDNYKDGDAVYLKPGQKRNTSVTKKELQDTFPLTPTA